MRIRQDTDSATCAKRRVFGLFKIKITKVPCGTGSPIENYRGAALEERSQLKRESEHEQGTLGAESE